MLLRVEYNLNMTENRQVGQLTVKICTDQSNLIKHLRQTNAQAFLCHYSQLLMSRTLICQTTSHIIEFGLDTFSIYSIHVFSFQICYLKHLVSQSKFSGTRKFMFRYQYFQLNFDFEIPRINCGFFKHLFL